MDASTLLQRVTWEFNEADFGGPMEPYLDGRLITPEAAEAADALRQGLVKLRPHVRPVAGVTHYLVLTAEGRRRRAELAQATVPTAPRVVQVLAGHLAAQGIASVRFIRYTPRSGAARRAIAEGADPVPLLMDTDEYGVFSEAPVRHALVGSPATEETVRAQYDLDPGEALALTTSLGVRPGMVRHLMMLDFREPVSPEATALLRASILHADWSGYLLASGASYHFLGSEPMELEQWRREMARAMLTPGPDGRNAIDVRYMAHTLANDRGGLRITRGAQKSTRPYLLERFGTAPAVPALEAR